MKIITNIFKLIPTLLFQHLLFMLTLHVILSALYGNGFVLNSIGAFFESYYYSFWLYQPIPILNVLFLYLLVILTNKNITNKKIPLAGSLAIGMVYAIGVFCWGLIHLYFFTIEINYNLVSQEVLEYFKHILNPISSFMISFIVSNALLLFFFVLIKKFYPLIINMQLTNNSKSDH